LNLKGIYFIMFNIPINTTDILVTNHDFGRIGLTAGIDLLPSATSVSIFQLGFPSVEAFAIALNKGAKAHIINKTVSIECITNAGISSSAANTPHDQVIGGEGTEEKTAENVVDDIVPPVVETPEVVVPVVKTPAPANNNNNKKR
jgi:hypothetical protein